MNRNNPDGFSQYYKRQILVENFGVEEQKKIADCSCLIVGMGGLGCPAGLYLTTSGVGHIGVCDHDEIEYSNLARQILFSPEDVGKKKSSVARRVLQEKNPFIRVEEYGRILNEANAREIISRYDIVLDCTDNFHSKYLIHDTCLLLEKNLVQGSLFQTHGQVIGLAFHYAPFKGCMRCLWKEEPPAQCVKSCAEAGILGVVAGTVALRQATTALQCLTGQYQNAGMSSLYSYNTQDWMHLPMPRNSGCPYCSGSKKPGMTEEPLIIDIMPDKAWCILDVRREKDQNNFFGTYPFLNVSRDQVGNPSKLVQKLNRDTHYVAVCYAGNRSLDVANKLRAIGFNNIHSYAGGYERFLTNERITSTRLSS